MMKAALFVLTALLVASCSTVHPDGAVDNVVSGDLFGGKPAKPVPDYLRVRPPPAPGPVRWRIDF